MSIGFSVTGLDAVQSYLRRVGSLSPESLIENVVAEVESQTRRRIEEERESPDGKKWPPWSPGYAATRHAGHSLLQDTGALVDSIQSAIQRAKAEVGTNLVYAVKHQEGDGVPQRQFLGIGAVHEREIDDVIKTWVEVNLSR